MSAKRILVVAAVIARNDQIFIAKRPEYLHQGGLWEFPGGKVEPTETPLQALQRELFEEIDIHVSSAQPLIKINHDYSDKSVCLDVWRVTNFHGTAKGKEGQQVLWVTKNDLHNYAFPAANKPILTAIQLPQTYLITPEPGLVDEDEFLSRLENAFMDGIKLAQFRTKTLTNNKLLPLYRKAAKIAEQHQARLLLNSCLEDAIKCDIKHIHLSAKNLLALQSIPDNFFTAASCHNALEVEKACELGVNFLVISPVNKTQSHPGATPLGWENFALLCENASVPVYALGGMTTHDVENAIKHGAQGIAAINALW